MGCTRGAGCVIEISRRIICSSTSEFIAPSRTVGGLVRGVSGADRPSHAVFVRTGHILLLDLGLATHFSLSKPRLTTCCGSPAYHSPEIVDALQNPPGTRTYYGPELDIWCIGLTLLSLLTGRKYPIGTSHKSPVIMAQGVKECLIEADKMVEDKSYERTGSDLNDTDWDEWVHVKRTIEGFMEIDGDTRMRNFAAYQVGRYWQDDASTMTPVKDCECRHESQTSVIRRPIIVLIHRVRLAVKTISFEKTDIKHPLPIFLTDRGPDVEAKDNLLWMCNPDCVGIKNVISYIKYLMRTEVRFADTRGIRDRQG